jgi:hypothetical protein
VGQREFSTAIRQFEEAVGKEWVFTSDEDLALYRDAYSPFWGEEQERIASAAVAPDTVAQVQQVVRTANRYRIPLYTISTGRNLAYGGSAPALSGSVVLDLKRMNRVVEVSEQNAYALVEPGVSYFDLYRYIQERGLKLMIDVPTPGWGSPLGNALDHGGGVTPMRDHFSTQCGMEVVLANGEVLRTGMGALPGAETWQQYKFGIGPYVDGIFSQSNFGVVTKMGLWLLPEPEVVRALHARHFILTTREKFDVITTDPIHPWVKGTSSLYSKEYYELVKQHLNPGGVVAQWLPIYDSDMETVKTELATFFSVFPNASVWTNNVNGEGYDLVLLGRLDAAPVNVDELQVRLERSDYGPVARSLEEVGIHSAVEFLATYAGNGAGLKPFVANAQINEDISQRLQYLAGLGVNSMAFRGIYREIVAHRRFPEGFFVGSAGRIEALRTLLRSELRSR